MKQDYYEVLGIGKQADEKDVYKRQESVRTAGN